MVRITNREAHLEQLRSKSIQIADEQGQKSRFGLFSQAPTYAIGDTQFVKHIPAKNEMGKPETQARNMLPGPVRGGIGKKGLFKEEEYITVGDKYIDQFKRDRQDELREKAKMPLDQPVMKPQNKTHLMGKMPYPYKEEMDMSRGKPVVRNLDEMGKPATQPTNMKAAINVDKIYKR